MAWNEASNELKKKFKGTKARKKPEGLKEAAKKLKKLGMDMLKIKGGNKKKMRGSNVHRQPMIRRGDPESKQKKLKKVQQ